MDRWKGALDDGFVVFPRSLLTQQSGMGLEANDVVVFLNLVGSWWAYDDAPYPSVHTLARRMGASTRTVQRSLKRLEAKGLVERQRNVPGNGRSLELKVTRYDLTGAAKVLADASLSALLAPRPETPAGPRSEFNAGRRVQPTAQEDFSAYL